MKEKHNSVAEKIDRLPIWLVFVATIIIGIASWYCCIQFGPLMIVHMILGVLYAAGGILFLFLCRHKCVWNLLPAAVGICTALFSMSLAIMYIDATADILDGIFGEIIYFAALPCVLFYYPLMMYVILVLGTFPLAGCIAMVILGVLLTVYCIRNIVKNSKNKTSDPEDKVETKLTYIT